MCKVVCRRNTSLRFQIIINSYPKRAWGWPPNPVTFTLLHSNLGMGFNLTSRIKKGTEKPRSTQRLGQPRCIRVKLQIKRPRSP